MASICSTSIPSTSIPSTLLTSSFKEKEAFKAIKELDFLSYYLDFKLILCSICQIGLVSNGYYRQTFAWFRPRNHFYKGVGSNLN
jgi:hypothetical protein